MLHTTRPAPCRQHITPHHASQHARCMHTACMEHCRAALHRTFQEVLDVCHNCFHLRAHVCSVPDQAALMSCLTAMVPSQSSDLAQLLAEALNNLRATFPWLLQTTQRKGCISEGMLCMDSSWLERVLTACSDTKRNESDLGQVFMAHADGGAELARVGKVPDHSGGAQARLVGHDHLRDGPATAGTPWQVSAEGMGYQDACCASQHAS